jgi:hypothetical protein
VIEYSATSGGNTSAFAGSGWLQSMQHNWPIVAGVLVAFVVLGFFLTKR